MKTLKIFFILIILSSFCSCAANLTLVKPYNGDTGFKITQQISAEADGDGKPEKIRVLQGIAKEGEIPKSAAILQIINSGFGKKEMKTCISMVPFYQNQTTNYLDLGVLDIDGDNLVEMIMLMGAKSEKDVSHNLVILKNDFVKVTSKGLLHNRYACIQSKNILEQSLENYPLDNFAFVKDRENTAKINIVIWEAKTPTKNSFEIKEYRLSPVDYTPVQTRLVTAAPEVIKEEALKGRKEIPMNKGKYF